MTNQNKPPFNTVPHYIASDYRGGELSINQLRLLLWLRLIGTPYGIATTSLVDLKNDVFPDLDLKINTINSMLLKLRQKQHVFFEPRQGKAGTFDIKLNHWMKPKKKYQTLDKFFPEPRQWISTEGEVTVEDSYPQDNPPEASQKLEEQNQKLMEQKDQLVKKVSGDSDSRQIRSYHNEHDTEHQLENHDTLEKVSFKGTLVKDYQRREAAADWARSHPDQIEPLMATEKAVLNQQLGAALQAQQNASQQLYSGVLPDFGGIVRDGIL